MKKEKNIYTLVFTNRVILDEMVDTEEANEIVNDIESFVCSYIKDKYNATLRGTCTFMSL